MKNIFKQLGLIAGGFALWYFLFFFISRLVYPPFQPPCLDNSSLTEWGRMEEVGVTQSIWNVRYPTSNKIFVLGASNARFGISPEIMSRDLPGFTVSNLASAASNMNQMLDDFDLVSMSLKGQLKGTVFVICQWYAQFTNDSNYGTMQWQGRNLTIVEAEALRYGLYHLEKDRLKPTFSPSLMPAAVEAVRPLLFLRYIFRWLEDAWKWFLGLTHKTKEMTHQEAIQNWIDYMGSIDDYMEEGPMVNSYLRLCKTIEQSGATLVLVDMPLPAWHREASTYQAKYIKKRGILLKQVMNAPHVLYVDLGTSLADSDFHDSAHPNLHGKAVLSQDIARFIHTHLSQLNP